MAKKKKVEEPVKVTLLGVEYPSKKEALKHLSKIRGEEGMRIFKLEKKLKRHIECDEEEMNLSRQYCKMEEMLNKGWTIVNEEAIIQYEEQMERDRKWKDYLEYELPWK